MRLVRWPTLILRKNAWQIHENPGHINVKFVRHKSFYAVRTRSVKCDLFLNFVPLLYYEQSSFSVIN